MKAVRNLRWIAAALAFVILAGTAGFSFVFGWPWLDGLYMVITTLTTIGYQETHPLSNLGRAFNLVLIFFGVGLVFLAIGALTQALLEFELRSFFWQAKNGTRHRTGSATTTSFVVQDVSDAARPRTRCASQCPS